MIYSNRWLLDRLVPPSRRQFVQALLAAIPVAGRARPADPNWSEFRGPSGLGVVDGFALPTSWNADSASGRTSGVRWRTAVPGLGHSSPILWQDRIYLATAIPTRGEPPLSLGRGAGIQAADDNEEQTWVILSYDKESGEELWRRTARRSTPRAERHGKATHANTTLVTNGRRLVAFLGSEGLYCYDLDGNLVWSRDLGTIDISKYGIGWGYGSSPAIHGDRIALLCDDPSAPFLAVMRLSDGEEVWRVSRKKVSERSWATPLIHSDGKSVQVVANGWPWIVSYDLETGRELWRLPGGGDNPTPTPFVANGWIYITNSHGGKSPIYVVRPEARGDISLASGETSNNAIVWSYERGGSYMATPVVYGEYIYFGNTNGVVRCYHATTGEAAYEERLATGASIYASLVAGDSKVFCTSEDGAVYVLQAGGDFKLLARNSLGEPCLATPAISRGILYFRTTRSLIAIA